MYLYKIVMKLFIRANNYTRRNMGLLLGKGDESFIYRENGRAPWIGGDVVAKECIRQV